MHVLAALQTAFSFWMLYDAAQRRADYYWYFIILMPFGEIIYFFAVKMHDPDMRSIKRRLTEKPITLKELEYNASTSPSIHNKVALAQALHDHQNYDRAEELFREVLGSDKENKKALYGLGLCLLKSGDAKEAVVQLQQLVDLDLSFSDYSPCADLAEAYWKLGETTAAIELLEKVAKKSERLSHKTELGRYLAEAKRIEDAKKLLEEALEDFEHSPAYTQRAQKKWAREARKILREI